MPPLDRSRFIYSLAGEWLAGEWTTQSMKASLKRAVLDRQLRLPGLAERVYAAFTIKPRFNRLVKLLLADARLARAIGREIDAKKKRPKSPSLRRPTMTVTPLRLAGIDLPKITTEAALAAWLDIDDQSLQWQADTTGRNRKHRAGPLRTYRYRWIPRRQGMPRLLEIPKATLKAMQRMILAEILNPVPVHAAAHGFRAGRSIVSNAAIHCGQSTVLRFDLVDFFPSVSSSRVFRIFRTLGYPARVAKLLMGICTTRVPADVWDARPGARDGSDYLARERLTSRHLPQGAPTSPALANLAAHRLDRRLGGLANSAGLNYSRYADDLTFSGGDDLARCRKRLETHIAVIAHEEGFTLNHRKTRMMRAGVSQQVTGIVVNVRPNIGRAEFDQIKAMLTNCIRHGPEAQNRDGHTNYRAHLAGKVAQIASIHAARGEKLRLLFRRISWKTKG
jgi:hypothetical protein